MSKSVEAAPTADQRAELLAQHVARAVAAGYRVESHTPHQGIVVKGHRINHLLHFFIGIFTLTLWWFSCGSRCGRSAASDVS